MENASIPPVRPVTAGTQTSVASVGAASSAAMNRMMTPSGNKDKTTLIMGIAIGVLAVLAIVFIGLFAWKSVEYDDLSTDVDIKIASAVSDAKTEQALADAEEAKKDTRQFTGPTDYGQLSFDYPKSWSVYIESDASKGGDFVAYLNPIEIEPVSSTSVYALRVTIRDKDFESVASEYQRYMNQKDSNLKMETITVGGTTANRYVGKIPGTDLSGIIVIFKIRDKTAVLRTDALSLSNDFQTILDTVRFNA